MSSPPASTRRLFPGDPKVWQFALALGAVLGVVLLYQIVVVKRDYYTGTNSVSNRSQVKQVKPRQELCVRGVVVPAGTARVRFAVMPAIPGGVLRVRVREGGRTVRSARGPPVPGGTSVADVAIPELDRTATRDVCVSPLGVTTFFYGVLEAQPDNPAPTLQGKRFNSSVATWFLPKAGEKRTILQSLPQILDRAALLRAGWIGPWLYVLIFLAFPLIAYAAVRLLATAEDASVRRRVPAVITVALIGFVWAASWSLITPAFDAPDEQDHTAYAQSLATTGKSSCRTCERPPYSTELSLGIEGSNIFAYNENAGTRPIWFKSQERAARDHLGSDPLDSNGGGNTTAATHGPYYYLSLVPAYALTKALGGDIFARLQAMRLMSALMAALVAAMIFLTGRELFPRRPLVGTTAALLVAVEPMVGFIGGAVNNDDGINAVMAVVAFTCVRILRRGLTWRRGIGLAALAVLGPVVKISGFAVLPPILLTLVLVALRQHRVRDVVPWAVTIISYAAFAVLRTFGNTLFTPDQGTAPTSGSASAPPATALTSQPLDVLSYVWQVFLPRLPFMDDYFSLRWPFYLIYVERGFAAFGWYAIMFPAWVYSLIIAVGAVVILLALSSVRLYWHAVKSRWRELLLLLGIGITVIGAIHAAFFAPAPGAISRGLLIGEQGRYAFPALTPIALFVAVSCYGLGVRWASRVAAVLVTLMLGLGWAAQLLAFTTFFT